jgi:hypothetical protein
LEFEIFLLGLIVVLIFVVLGLVERNVEWAVFPGMGIIIGLFLTIALLADGSLTQLSGGVDNVIASASLNGTSVWQFIEWTPMTLTIGAFLTVVYKVGSAF